MLKNTCVISISLFLLVSCGDANKIGIEDSTEMLPDDIKSYTTSTESLVTDNAEVDSVENKVEQYIKNNFASVNPTGNNYDSLLDIVFEGVDNISIEYLESEVRYKLLLNFSISDSNRISLTRLGYYKKVGSIWERLSTVPKGISSDNDKKEDNNTITETGTSKMDSEVDSTLLNEDKAETTMKDNDNTDNQSEKERIEDIVKNSDKEVGKIKGYDVLEVKGLSLQVQYPQYWYWRWFPLEDKADISIVGFSKVFMDEDTTIDDATIVLKIKEAGSDKTKVSANMTSITKPRDEETMFEVIGPKDDLEVLQTVLDTAIKMSVKSTGTISGATIE